jgi:hypothetical protein
MLGLMSDSSSLRALSRRGEHGVEGCSGSVSEKSDLCLLRFLSRTIACLSVLLLLLTAVTVWTFR